MRDAAAGRRMLQMRDPRHVRFNDDHQIGVGQKRAGLETEMHRVARRQAHCARTVRNDRDGAAFGQALKRGDSLGRQGRGDDQWPFGGGDPFGERCDRARIGMCRRCLRPRLYRSDRLGKGCGERFARQHEIDRPARVRHRDFDTACDNVTDLARHAQFVVPFHQLAHHAGLVEHFLRPVDRAAARTERAFLRDRRAARRQNERHAIAREVCQVVDRVSGADVNVNHHRLRTAVHQVGAVCHGDRKIFVRHQNRLRHLGVGLLGAAEGLDDRREVRAGIGEEIVGAVIGQRAQECLGGDCWPLSARCRRHALFPWVVRPRFLSPVRAIRSERRLLLAQSLIRRGRG